MMLQAADFKQHDGGGVSAPNSRVSLGSDFAGLVTFMVHSIEKRVSQFRADKPAETLTPLLLRTTTWTIRRRGGYIMRMAQTDT